MIASLNLSWRYSHFSQTPAPPYVVYYFPSSSNVYADCKNYVDKEQLFIELYAKSKDATNESAIESALNSVGLTWYKQTDFLNDEKLFQTTYETEVIING